jgi:uncharacterized protein (TIGR03086 family)
MDEISAVSTALSAIDDVLTRIGDHDLDRPTPCRDFKVRDLAEHLLDFVTRLGAAAGIDVPETGTGGIRDRIVTAASTLIARWQHRGLDGTVDFAGRTLPDRLALGIFALELTVHGWDFATAMHRPLAVTESHASSVLTLAHQTLTPQSRANAGFDAPIPIDDQAPALDRLVAFTGRNPHHPIAATPTPADDEQASS